MDCCSSAVPAPFALGLAAAPHAALAQRLDGCYCMLHMRCDVGGRRSPATIQHCHTPTKLLHTVCSLCAGAATPSPGCHSSHMPIDTRFTGRGQAHPSPIPSALQAVRPTMQRV